MEYRLFHVPGAVIRTAGPGVVLTIDDGPHPGTTTRLLDVLAQHGATATFYLIGSQVSRHPELARAIAAAGHEVGNHSQTHANLVASGSGRIDRELASCQQAIQQATGVVPSSFRPPYGAVSRAVVDRARGYGLITVLWSIDTRDWSAKSGVGAIIQRASAARQGDIVLLHDLPGRGNTASALPAVLRSFASRGLGAHSFSRARQLGPPTPHSAVPQ